MKKVHGVRGGWKNNTGQTCSYPRVRFGIMCANCAPQSNPSNHHSTIVLRGLGGLLNRALIMPRDASISDSGCDFSRCGSVAYIRYYLDRESFYFRTIHICAYNVYIVNIFIYIHIYIVNIFSTYTL